jgi:L-lactate dehydrogenase (cytochrome)
LQGIVVSNHGGRQLDYARSAIEVLPEVMAALQQIGAENKLEVFVDGGVRRGTDIFKVRTRCLAKVVLLLNEKQALALGAKAVGIGRPVLYGMAAYGQEGVERVLQLLKDELEMVMRLMGTPTLADIKPEMVVTNSLHQHFVPSPADFLSKNVYVPLPLPKL